MFGKHFSMTSVVPSAFKKNYSTEGDFLGWKTEGEGQEEEQGTLL